MRSFFSWVFLLVFFTFLASPARAQKDSLDIKIGQMIIFGFYGTSINKKDPVYKAVQQGKIGSLLLYKRNITTTNAIEKLKALIDSFQRVATIPLFISIDQEGGVVNRFEDLSGMPSMPSAFFLGNKNDTALTRKSSSDIARLLATSHINLNYAPVLDVHNGNCPVMGARNRCFSPNPKTIAIHATQVVEAHNNFKVHTIVKHFPGHGNSLSDSHFGIADVTKTWKKEELEPYRLLINSCHAEAVMTAHIVNGKLDPSLLPATLSKRIITGLLRDSLNFKGPVFSDDMMMQAISSHYGIEESIMLAVNAGVDVLMFSNNIKGVAQYSPNNIHKIIKSLVIRGKISPEKINTSYQRIMAMKNKWR
jgi:beta-N-acetylhexosaminidase